MMLRKTTFACMSIMLFSVRVVSAQTIPVPITNSGAELGTTSGWTDSAGIFQADNTAPAAGGTWFFESTEHLNFFNRPMTQMLDVSAWTGSIDDVIFSVSMAASAGLAQFSGPSGTETWTYLATPGLRFFDVNMAPVFVGLRGPSAIGDDALAWTQRELQWANFDPGWDQFKANIAHIEIELSGGWQNDQTFAIEDPPTGSITNVPEVTRFDDVAVSLVVPEPGTLSLLAVGLAAGLRRRSRAWIVGL